MHLIYQTDLRTTCPKPFRRGKKGTYCIRQRIGGKDVWRSLRTSDKKEAEYLATSIWRAQQSGLVRSLIPVPPMPLALLWHSYTQTERYTTLAASTKQTKETAWLAFLRHCEAHGIKYSTDLTPERAEAYLNSVGKKNKTFNNVLGDLRTVFSAAEENPFESIKPKPIRRGAEGKVSERINAFSDADAARILDKIRASKLLTNIDQRVDLCNILDNTGLRYKDAALLRFDQIREVDGKRCIVLSPHKTATATGGKMVMIALTATVSEIIDRRAASGSEYVLPGMAEEYEQRGNVSAHWLDRIFYQLGIKSSAHGYRVRLVTKAALAGIDLKAFGGVVGHTTEAQTNAYNRAASAINLEEVTCKAL